MKKNLFWSLLLAFGVLTASCSDDDDNGGGNPAGNGGGGTKTESYVIAAAAGDAGYLLLTDNLVKGDLTAKGGGTETESATAWEFHKSNKYLYRLVYNQGNAGLGSSYILDENGNIKERNIGFEIKNRFTTYGSYDKFIITAAAGTTDTQDAAGNYAQGVTFTIINVEEQTLTTKTIVTENFLDNGEYITFSGIEEVNGKLYTAVCPLGVSAYGVTQGYGSEVTTTTAYPDNVWIAVFDDETFENYTIIEDDRLSYATSRYRSQYYSNIATDSNNNIYVFSSVYDDTSSKKSGVIRINSGKSEFDQDFYFDIETAAGGLHLFKVWYITGDYFLIQTYTDESMSYSDTRKLAIFDASKYTDPAAAFTWVTGLPDINLIGSFGKEPYVENGTIYMPVVHKKADEDEENESKYADDPALYVINPATAEATKGISIAAESVAAVGILKK